MRLRRKYPESVQAALVDKRKGKEGRATPAKQQPTPNYVISCDDLWDWERGEPSTLARHLLNAEDLQEFSKNVKGKIRFLADSFKSDDLVSTGLYMMLRRLSCHMVIGPLKNDPGAVAETKRRLAFLSAIVDQLIAEKPLFAAVSSGW